MSFIEQCEQEQLHLSGLIQPHGALIIVNSSGEVTHLSDNYDAFNLFADEVRVGQLLPPEIHALLDLIPKETGKHHPSQIAAECGDVFYVVLSRTDEAFALEFYPGLEPSTDSLPQFDLPSTFNDLEELGYYREQLLSWIQKLTGHERVMYYQFMDNGDGLVTSEVCSDSSLGTYLDLRFPASDVPQIARDLYVKNLWREIPDAQAKPVSLLGKGGRPDLSYVDLRSVSPVHQIYMKNMGVGSTVSFPVIKNEKLDALISCHSSSPKSIPRENLYEVSAMISRFNFLLRELDTRKRLELIDEFNFKTQRLRNLLDTTSSMEESWDLLAGIIKSEFEVDTVVLCSDQFTYIYGNELNHEFISSLDDWFIHNSDELVFYTDNISGEISNLPLSEVAGFTALRFRSGGNNSQLIRLYLTRCEFLYEVQWGGNPNKPVENHEGNIKISPRQSFAKWIEKRMGYCRPWSSHTNLELHRLRGLLESSKMFEADI
ncbi:GAF domain-containing protein [Neptuniibacter sp.]|uniref:GAF domain-containing protein n=1 Tax=Neptuniibacter sp. TaxID=1962643 RepID=UPI00260C0CB0|nr:GAF domain-containing protein [Neptuniibacter sp.]MCP4595488.1 GAF domain-containing protein [Neptuniibacter sp.]